MPKILIVSLLLCLVISGCQQEKTTPDEPPQELAASDMLQQQIDEAKALFQTNIEFGITMLADTTTLPSITYEAQHGIVTNITKAIEPIAITALDDLELSDALALTDDYTLTWSTDENMITALHIMRNTPTLKQDVFALSLLEKTGQMIVTGFEGTTVTADLRYAVEERKISNIILFKKNITGHAQLQQLSTTFHNLTHTYPLWISIDEEGGNVSRLPSELVKLPTAAQLATVHTPQQVENIANHLGQALSAYGIQLDFAPVMDINSNPNNPVIGTRSFSSEPQQVANYALAFHNGLASAHVVSAMKHFPGHGNTDVDSHVALPIINATKEELLQHELIPFIAAIKEQAPMIMVGHLLIPALDQDAPASISKAIITNLLRHELRYQGLIITDDVTMDALQLPIAQIAVQTVTAGSDLVLVGHGLDRALEAQQALIEAVEDGVIAEAQINESVLRIIQTKQQFGEAQLKTFDLNAWNATMQQLLQ